ncbi:MAG: hypothetical protein ACOZCL_01265 [Bacillota bacterium]
MRILSAIKFDIRFQIRHGFYYAYLFISVLYILLLRVLPEGVREYVAAYIIFSDPSALGFFFIGGIILMEKGQSIFENLFVTPFKPWEYLLSKVFTLTMLALVSSLLIVIASVGFDINFPVLVTGIVLSSVFFTLLGLTLAFISKTVNQYFISAALYMPVLFLPVLEFLGIYTTPIFNFLPTKPSLLLLQGAFSGISGVDFIYSLAVFILWIVIASIWAYSWFIKYIILGIGGGSK